MNTEYRENIDCLKLPFILIKMQKLIKSMTSDVR